MGSVASLFLLYSLQRTFHNTVIYIRTVLNLLATSVGTPKFHLFHVAYSNVLCSRYALKNNKYLNQINEASLYTMFNVLFYGDFTRNYTNFSSRYQSAEFCP